MLQKFEKLKLVSKDRPSKADVQDRRDREQPTRIVVQQANLDTMQRLGHVHEADLEPVNFSSLVIEAYLGTINRHERAVIGKNRQANTH